MTAAALWPADVPAQQGPTVDERLIRLEEGQKALAERIDDLRADTNKRFEELRADTNKRFEELRADMNQRFNDLNGRFSDLNGRFSDLQLWLQIMSAVLALVLGWQVRQGLVVSRRLIQVDTTLSGHLRETEKDQMITMQRREISAMKERLDRLEGSRP